MTERVLFASDPLSVKLHDDGIAEIILDLKGESVNKFNRTTLEALRSAVDHVKQAKEAKGLLISSAKDVFVVGADITEFLGYFSAPESELEAWLHSTHAIFNDIEDLTIPSVAAIGGVCLGGGFELALATTYRVASTKAKVGLPETKLGIYPGWGGTIRLPRLIGADNAIEWIAGGSQFKPQQALEFGAVDAVVDPSKLRTAALHQLKNAIDGRFDWQQRRAQKIQPLQLRTLVEGMMVFEGAKGFVGAKAGPNYPAPVEAIKVMQKCAGLDRDKAIASEIKGFIKMAHTPCAESLVTIFLADQFNKKKVKTAASSASAKTERAAVLGAGIMGGGIAYQSASRGVPIIMKDIQPQALELGMGEASKLLAKQVQRGKIDTTGMAKTISAITPTLSYGDLPSAQVVVEAVVENPDIKKKVLREVEDLVPAGTVLASNTSTISISSLAEGLSRPQDFCGMHFFNPVHRMPLVEVIRGEKTSDDTIARTVAYASAMGKTPIVVNDCPGFLVNRILFPYFAGLMGLLEDGVDFRHIDKVMEKYGWPMGPCYLLDVVGIDTAVHAAEVMGNGFPDRMRFSGDNAMSQLAGQKRYGQKTGSGFYQYTIDKKGKPKKSYDSAVEALLAPAVKNKREVSDEQIIDRLMIPMANEAALCLQDKIVDTAMEVDLGLIYGLGFPPFRGGVLKELDRQGADAFVKRCADYSGLGNLYQPVDLIKEKAASGAKFYP